MCVWLYLQTGLICTVYTHDEQIYKRPSAASWICFDVVEVSTDERFSLHAVYSKENAAWVRGSYNAYSCERRFTVGLSHMRQCQSSLANFHHTS